MTVEQRRLIIGSIVLMLVGTVYGAVYTYVVEHETLLVLRETYKSAFVAAADGNMDAARAALERAKGMNYRYVRMIDSHTHIIKLATLVLLIALLYPLIGWQASTRRWLAVGFTAGVVIFPTGLFLQMYSTTVVFRALAAAGAVLVIGCFTLIVVGLFMHGDGGDPMVPDKLP